MTPDLLELMTHVSEPSLSPDGAYAVVATSRASFAGDSYVGQLWLIKTDGSEEPRRLTRGLSDSAPQFSPDGKSIAFLRPGKNDRPQLALLDARGGEPLLITNRHLGVSSFIWSPDSSQLVFVSRTPEDGRYGTVTGVGPGQEDARLITSNKARANGLGWANDKRSQIFILDAPSLQDEPFVTPVGRVARDQKLETEAAADSQFPSLHALSAPEFDAGSPVFSADGSQILFTSAQHEGRDDDLRSGIYRVEIVKKAEVAGHASLNAPHAELVLGSATGDHSFSNATVSTDGSVVYALGQNIGATGIDFVAKNTGVYAIAYEDLPATEATLLTELENSDYGDVHAHLVPEDDGAVLAFARTRGRGELHRVTLDRSAGVGTVHVLSAGNRVISGAAHRSGLTVVTYTDPTTPGEVGILDGATIGEKQLTTLTHFAKALQEQTVINEPQEFTATSADGYPVHGWIFLPQGEGPHPVLLNIHGGPFADYDWSYFDEAQAYTNAGYAVLQCNPRGSAGYGQAHGRAIKHAMGILDLQDVLAFLDGAIATEPRIDGTRAGVLGGSYGGYLTAWTIAHDHRFKAAIVERGYLEPLSFVGTSDIGWFFAEEYTGTERVHIEAQSPYAVVDQVKTPTFVIHSEEDLRCPLEQAQRYFLALKRTGTPTQMLVFPGENHELSRAGTPWHRRQRFEAILGWWEQYLPVAN